MIVTKFLKDKTKKIDGFVDISEIENFREILEKNNVSMTANKEFFRKDHFGIFPTIVEKVFLGRKEKKSGAKKLYNELQDLKAELAELEKS